MAKRCAWPSPHLRQLSPLANVGGALQAMRMAAEIVPEYSARTSYVAQPKCVRDAEAVFQKSSKCDLSSLVPLRLLPGTAEGHAAYPVQHAQASVQPRAVCDAAACGLGSLLPSRFGEKAWRRVLHVANCDCLASTLKYHAKPTCRDSPQRVRRSRYSAVCHVGCLRMRNERAWARMNELTRR